MSIPERALGFHTQLFTMFPLPRQNVGQSFTREYNGVRVTYTGELGVPYKPTDRRILEIITTKAIQSKSRLVEFGSVTSELARYGFARTGGYIKPWADSLRRFAVLGITPTITGRHPQDDKIRFAFTRPFFFAEEAMVVWTSGRIQNPVQPELIDRLTHLTLSEGAARLLENAVPHDQRHIMKIQSPLEMDIYLWLVSKLGSLEESELLVPWSWLYAQFGQRAEKLNKNQMRHFREDMKSAFSSICTEYYPAAKVELNKYAKGVLLKKSPPLIERDNPNAGYSP